MVQIVPEEIVSKKILFIGNSHTNFNGGLDTHLRGFVNTDDTSNLIAIQAFGGFTLKNHLDNQSTLDIIASEEWDFIVLQENSYIAAFEPNEMLDSIERFKTLFAQSGSEIYLFKTWAYEDMPVMNTLLTNVYNQAHINSGFKRMPIGTYWTQFHNEHTTSLYNDDGIHPNLLGTYLNAAIFFKKFYDVNDLTRSGYEAMLTEDQAIMVKAFVSDLAL